MNEEDRRGLAYYYAVKWIRSIKGYGRVKTRELITSIGDIEKFAFGSSSDLQKHFDYLDLPMKQWLHKRDFHRFKLLYEEQVKHADKICHFWSDDFPELLRQVNDPPLFLFLKGDLTLLEKPKIAIVGTRIPTDYGRRYAMQIGKMASESGKTVVSGMAMGIDAVAHMAALEGLGSSIGVLGCGIDQIYPKQNTRLFRDMESSGLLLTEYEVGSMPHPIHFPERNRIIAGLSEACIVIEAAKKSGSLITAEMAMDLGRDVLALPGPIYSQKSTGCHELIRNGAEPIVDLEDLKNLWRQGPGFVQNSDESVKRLKQENPLVAILGRLGQATTEDLVRESGLAFGVVIGLLDELERNKIVKSFGFFYHL